MLRARGVVEDRLVQRRRSRQHRDLLFTDAPHHLAGVEDGVRHDGRAAHEACQDPRLVAERVEERVDDQVAVALAEANDVRPHLEDAERLRVRRHDAFGPPGRAAGVDQGQNRLGVVKSVRAGVIPPAQRFFVQHALE